MKTFKIFIGIFIIVSCSEKKTVTPLINDDGALFGENNEKALSDSNTAVVVKDAPNLDESDISATVISAGNGQREELVDFAKQYIGTPYKFACSDPAEGFDCSGFINFVYRHFGYDVPRSSKDFEFYGTEVSPASAQVGDLVLFTPTEQDTIGYRVGHIGILINQNGFNSDFIHASSGKANGVTVSSISQPHYRKRFVKIISVIK